MARNYTRKIFIAKYWHQLVQLKTIASLRPPDVRSIVNLVMKTFFQFFELLCK